MAGTFEDHQTLWNTVGDIGVVTEINPKDCDSETSGFYTWKGGQVRLVICQDNGLPGGPEVAWTANDLDTLRHEAHHLVQDCLDGNLGDYELSLVYDSQDKLADLLVDAGVSIEQAKWIINSYAEGGASEDVIYKELEAFAIAELNAPTPMANFIGENCKVNTFRF